MVQASVLGPCRRALGAASALAVLGTGALFIFAGLDKLADPAASAAVLAAHGLVGPSVAPVAAPAIGAAELLGAAAGVWLLVGSRRMRAALVVASGAWLTVSIYSLALAAQPPPAPVRCGCALLDGMVSDWRPIAARNLILASACLALAAARPRPPPAIPYPAHPQVDAGSDDMCVSKNPSARQT